MLYLFTGVPGAGKTLQVVSMLANRKDFKDRPLFIDGIPDLKIPHEQIPEGESIKTWPKWAPDGAVIVVDECQRIFRPRSSSSAVPEYVSELETHRHRGLDFLLITQHPRLIDVHLRSLIEHHTHFSKTNLGFRRKLEWTTGGAKDPESRANIKEALVSVYKLDKSTFGLYKSAEQHTKIKTKTSKILFLVPVFIALLIFGLYAFYSYWQSLQKPIDTAPKGQTVQTAPAPIAAQAASPEVAAQGAASAAHGADTAGQYAPAAAVKAHLTADDYKPRIDGQPHTAPLYDGLNRAVKTMPYPVGCVKNADRCTCYTEQGTAIKGFSKSQCLDFVENGIYNPYKEQQTVENQPPTVQEAQAEAGQVLVMGGKSPQNLMYDGYADKALTNTGGKMSL